MKQATFYIILMRALDTLFSIFFCSSKSFKIPSECMLQRHFVFIYFSAVLNRFKYHQYECFKRNNVLYFPLHFQIVSNTVRMHHLPSLFSFFSLQFQILYTVRMHALDPLFSIFLCSSKSFQILSERMLQIHSFHLFLCSSESFQIRSECMLQRHRFQCFL